MSQDHHHVNHAASECKYHVHAEIPQESAVCSNLAPRGAPGDSVGRDEETIRADIGNQELADKQLNQMQLKLAPS